MVLQVLSEVKAGALDLKEGQILVATEKGVNIHVQLGEGKELIVTKQEFADQVLADEAIEVVEDFNSDMIEDFAIYKCDHEDDPDHDCEGHNLNAESLVQRILDAGNVRDVLLQETEDEDDDDEDELALETLSQCLQTCTVILETLEEDGEEYLVCSGTPTDCPVYVEKKQTASQKRKAAIARAKCPDPDEKWDPKLKKCRKKCTAGMKWNSGRKKCVKMSAKEIASKSKAGKRGGKK